MNCARISLRSLVSVLCLALGASVASAQGKPAATPPATSPSAAKPATTEAKVARQAKPKPISPADQRAIIELFKNVDPSKYRLEFNHGTTVVGKRKVEMGELEQVRKVTNPGEAAGYVVLIVMDDGVMYILATTGNKQLIEVLGAEKASKLNQIMAKYSRAGMHE